MRSKEYCRTCTATDQVDTDSEMDMVAPLLWTTKGCLKMSGNETAVKEYSVDDKAILTDLITKNVFVHYTVSQRVKKISQVSWPFQIKP